MNGRLSGIEGSGSEIDEWWELDPDICGAGGCGVYLYGGACWGANGGTGADVGAGVATLECVCLDLRPGLEADECWELDPDVCREGGCVAYPYGGADGGTCADVGAGAATLECVCVDLRPGLEADECWELDPDICGAGGCVAYPYEGANAGTGADVGAGAAMLECGRVELGMGGGGGGWEGYWGVCMLELGTRNPQGSIECTT
jgi:hypothetical protein